MVLATGILTAMLVMGSAGAKGPTEATLEGPGIDETTLGMRGGGEWGTELASIVETAFFPGVFGPPGVLEIEGEPRGPLRPRYTLTYRVPMRDRVDRVVQYVYPFADGGGYTFTPKGQPVLGDETEGGWIRAPQELKRVLDDLGVSPPTVSNTTERDRTMSLLAMALAPAAALAIGAGWLIRARRRRRAPTADVGIEAA